MIHNEDENDDDLDEAELAFLERRFAGRKPGTITYEEVEAAVWEFYSSITDLVIDAKEDDNELE